MHNTQYTLTQPEFMNSKIKRIYIKLPQRLSSLDGSSTIGRSSSLSQEKQGIIQDTGEAYLSHEESKYRVIETVWWIWNGDGFNNTLHFLLTWIWNVFTTVNLHVKPNDTRPWEYLTLYKTFFTSLIHLCVWNFPLWINVSWCSTS